MPKIYSQGEQLPASHLTEIAKVTGLFAIGGGTGNAHTITVTPAPSGYVDGDEYTFKAIADNTGSATLNVNDLGAKTIKKNVSNNLEAGDIKAGQAVRVKYDGTNFQLVSPIAPKSANGTESFSASGTITINCGFKPKGVRIHAIGIRSGNARTAYSHGSYSADTNTNNCIYVRENDNGSIATAGTAAKVFVISQGVNPGTHEGVINNLTSSGFDIVNTKTGGGDNMTFFWEAYA
jgi:hypothetical protein